ncbi:MAG: hypothetical protein VXY77_00275 [Pseudomonadota bacterium]|nr:hypothetical protein [Pseudomonadota bacterium]
MNNNDQLNPALESLLAMFKKIFSENRQNLPRSCSIVSSFDTRYQILKLSLLVDTDLKSLSKKQKERIQRVKLAFLHQARDVLKQKGLGRISVEVIIKQKQALSPSQSTIDTLVNDLKIIEGLQGLETAIEVMGKSMPGKYENLVQIVPRFHHNKSTGDQLTSLINFMQQMVRLYNSNISHWSWVSISQLYSFYKRLTKKVGELSEQAALMIKSQQEHMAQLCQYVPKCIFE